MQISARRRKLQCRDGPLKVVQIQAVNNDGPMRIVHVVAMEVPKPSRYLVTVTNFEGTVLIREKCPDAGRR